MSGSVVLGYQLRLNHNPSAAAEPKAVVWGKMAMKTTQGKKGARAALPAFTSPPQGRNTHDLQEAHASMFLTHSSFKWGQEDPSPRKQAVFLGVLCRR